MTRENPLRLIVLNHLKGGLGNQLFQYIFARSLAKKLQADLVTDESTFELDPYGRRSYITELDPDGRTGSIAEFSGPGAYLLQDGILQSLQDSLVLPDDTRVLVLSGYWQNENLLDALVARDTFSQLCEYAKSHVPSDLVSRISGSPNAIAVHVRRKDYAHMGLCKESYYCAAIEYLQHAYQDTELFVFTDEPNFVRHWLGLRGLKFSFVTCGNDLGDLFLMALCKHFVIANSSYSWWAAYWGEARGGLIFCPREWVTIGNAPSPCTARWIQIADAVQPFELDEDEVLSHSNQIHNLLYTEERLLATAKSQSTSLCINENTYSNLIDLRAFFADMPDFVVIKLPAHYPNYRDHEDIDIICRDVAEVHAHILQVGQQYAQLGFRFEEHRDNGHLHLDVYPPAATRLNFRFDLLANLTGFQQFTVDPNYHNVVLDSKRQIVQNSVPVFVPSLAHELVVRCLEYVEWKDKIPSKRKHLDYILAHDSSDLMSLISRYTNLTLPSNAPQPATERIAQSSSRMDYLLIWGHGLTHAHQIISMIRSHTDLEIITIVKRDIENIAEFVQGVYACDTVPFEHLVTKTRYLLNTPPHVLFILLKNHRPQEMYFGEGAFRHIQCRLIKDVKDSIRDRFNPRTLLGTRSEHHVIHASDYPSQVAHVLSILGLPPIAHYECEAHPDIDAPYHLAPLGKVDIREVTIGALFASILGKGLVAIKGTPHYQYVIGNRQPYLEYIDEHFGLTLTDDHLPESFDDKITNFSYGKRLPNGKLNLIVCKPLQDGRYQILDGAHRAAILANKGNEVIKIAAVEGD